MDNCQEKKGDSLINQYIKKLKKRHDDDLDRKINDRSAEMLFHPRFILIGDLIKYMLDVAWSVCKTLQEISEPLYLERTADR